MTREAEELRARLPAACTSRYRPDELIASGGFGSVWKAWQVQLARPVALKSLHEQTLCEPDLVERFLDEARITAKLSHPAIVRLIDHGYSDGVPWIVYEYAGAASLRERMDAGRLTEGQALALGVQLASALDAAHAQGILHRDIKPENVLEPAPGAYKLADFGIAKWAASQVPTQTGVVLGTPAYMSAQVLAGEPFTPDADLYALATLLWESVRGELPLWRDNIVETLIARQYGPAPRGTASMDAFFARALSPDTAAVLEQALCVLDRLAPLVDAYAAPAPAGLPPPRWNTWLAALRAAHHVMTSQRSPEAQRRRAAALVKRAVPVVRPVAVRAETRRDLDDVDAKARAIAP